MFKQLVVPFGIVLLWVFSVSAMAADGKTKATPCFACHGEDGNGNVANKLWPKLASQNVAYLVKQMNDFKHGAHGPTRKDATMNGMIMSLVDKDFSAVARYFSSLPITRRVVEDQYFKLGQKLYRAGDAERKITACTACHGARGEGLATAGFPSLSGQNAEYINKQLKDFRSRSRKNDKDEVMRNVAKLMSDEQIEAVAHYVGGLH